MAALASETIVQYVPHERVEEFRSKGWVAEDGDVPCHHNRWSRLMVWRGEGEPPEEAK